jgi:Tol biopolymer transport system component
MAVAVMGWRQPAATTVTAVPLLNFSRLTMQRGVALDPSLSPDGKWVVYVNGTSGNQDIYLQSTTGQTAINLTKDAPLGDTQPAFSPDGDSIVFRSERDGGGLFVMGRTGESVRRLTRSGYHPSWFPDGKQVVFTSQLVASVESKTNDVSELWIVGAGGENPRRFYAGDAVNPRVSPHGRRVAVWGLTGGTINRDVWTVAADGADPVRVTTDDAYDWNPVWSPDGAFLYFLSNRSGSMNLWRVGIDEASGHPKGLPQPLTVPSQYIRHFSLSADGRLAAYATWAVTNNIARVPFDSRTGSVRGPVEQITTGPRDFGRFDVSPDGTQLVAGNSSRQQEDLFLLGNDGSSRQLTNDRARDRHPRWSPDGHRIFFYADRDGSMAIMSIDRDGGSLRQLTSATGATSPIYPVPSPNALRVAATDNGWKMFVYDARDFSKAAEELPPFPEELRRGILNLSQWSADGKLLGGTTLAAAWVYSFETRTYRSFPALNTAHVSWLPDSRRFVGTQQGKVLVVDSQSGMTREIFEIPGEAIGTARVTDDGSYLYITHGNASGDIWTARFGEK